jgi:fumarylacetoacetate (FAA) hydrolase
MKLATLRNGSRDGALTIVSRDLKRAVSATAIAPTLQAAIDDWHRLVPALRRRYDALNHGHAPDAFDIDWRAFSAPLPRAYGWMDSSVYLSHMELARKLRGAPMPEGYRDEPRFYDGVSSRFLATGDPLPCPPGDIGLDIEGELAVILDDVAQRTSADDAAAKILLFALVNDTSLRTIFAEQAARGYTNYHGKPPCSMAPVVVERQAGECRHRMHDQRHGDRSPRHR